MEKQTFTTVIKPKSGWFDLHLKEVFAYRDLIYLFVKRNFVSSSVRHGQSFNRC